MQQDTDLFISLIYIHILKFLTLSNMAFYFLILFTVSHFLQYLAYACVCVYVCRHATYCVPIFLVLYKYFVRIVEMEMEMIRVMYL